MGDGRFDQDRLIKAVIEHSAHTLLFDMDAVAQQSGAIVNAVMLGALAGGGRLPIPVEALEAAIRADGKAVESNLRGFRAGLDAARGESASRRNRRTTARAASPALLEHEVSYPAGAGASDRDRRRAAADRPTRTSPYARLYLDRLRALVEPMRRRGAGRLLDEIARHLAVRMSYEDVVRVAQAKIEPARFAASRARIARQDEPYVGSRISSSPASRSCADPAAASGARRSCGYADTHGWLGRVWFRHGGQDHLR